MLLRKLTAALCPLLLCVAVCAVYRWLDGLFGAAAFLSFALKGGLLGAALALVLPLAGVRAHTNGLAGWLWLGAGLLMAALFYQYFESVGVLHWPVLLSLLPLNGQAVLVEGAAAGYLAAAAALYRGK